MDFILRLKEFYILELLQLKLYQKQVDSLEDSSIRHAYDRMVELEQNHVEYYKNQLNKNGEKPPIISGGLTELAGLAGADGLNLIDSSQSRYLVGMKVEQKAMEMYKAFILETWDNPEICKKLWSNMVDEEFHMLWFKERLKECEQKVH